MRQKLLISAFVATVAIASNPAFARKVISIEAAEQVCLERAQRYAKSVTGRDYSTPEPNQIRDKYRSCVYSKSRQYPRNRLNIRGAFVTAS